MSIEKAVIRMLEGKEITITEQTPIPCFRCGICCTCYQPPLTEEDVDRIASALGISRSKCISRYAHKAPIKEGYLLKHARKGCVFLTWEADGKARCDIHPWRPRACREWTPSLAKPECREGLARLKPEGQIVLPEDLLSSQEEQRRFCQSLKSDPD